MADDAGLIIVAVSYNSPCTIHPVEDCLVWNPLARSYLNVALCAKCP